MKTFIEFKLNKYGTAKCNHFSQEQLIKKFNKYFAIINRFLGNPVLAFFVFYSPATTAIQHRGYLSNRGKKKQNKKRDISKPDLKVKIFI